MGRAATLGLFTVALLATAAAAAQQVVDRVVARVEGDIVLESEVRELGQYQQLIEGREETASRRLDRLIDQWIVRTEGEAALFPRASTAEVDAGIGRLRASFAPDEFQKRFAASGLNEAALRRLVADQLYLTRYLDSRFRAAAQVEPAAIEAYYRDEFVPRIEKAGTPVLPLREVRGQIREVLVARGINQQAERWLEESRARLHIEKVSP
jgi:peptidyl-prolyl cis-trans isomerase SurA